MLTRRELQAGAVWQQAGPQLTFRLWAFGDAHVGTDKHAGRDSMARAIRQSESDFDWDVAIDIGDMSGAQSNPPADEEGQEIVRQFQSLRKHRREDIYSVSGNHDRSGPDQPDAWWWQKWVDPLGVHTKYSGVDAARRKYPVQGTWERYSFRIGNLIFLMMSDRNERSVKFDRATLRGNPGGVVSGETFAWWKNMVEANRDSIVISVHHYVLKNTTVASGEWEGMKKDKDENWISNYHGYFPQGTPKGASYLYWVDGKPDAQAFENYLELHPAAVDVWLAGHTHTNPDDTYGGKSHIERKWGTSFLNVSALSQYHGWTNVPMSRLLTFVEGSKEVKVQCYLHTSQHAPQGWYSKVERTLELSQPLQL